MVSYQSRIFYKYRQTDHGYGDGIVIGLEVSDLHILGLPKELAGDFEEHYQAHRHQADPSSEIDCWTTVVVCYAGSW